MYRVLADVVRHHAQMTNAGQDPASLLNHARRLRPSVGADRIAEMDRFIAELEARRDISNYISNNVS